MTTYSDDIIKKKIIETVRNHPEGLTIKDLSTVLKAHRQTVTKYILFLEGAGIIHRRRIGSATLHYLKEKYDGFHNISTGKNKSKRRST